MQSVRGTRDVLNLESIQGIKRILGKALESNNFNEISIPILEHPELFQKAVGQNTDVVSKEMFFVAGKEDLQAVSQEVCLRPELTSSITRAYCNWADAKKNFKCFTWGQCFRRERPQKGRLREFTQLSVEIIDAKSYFFDVELLEMFYRSFISEFQISNFIVEINYLSCPEERSVYREKLTEYLARITQELCAGCNGRREANPLRCFDCKHQTCISSLIDAPILEASLSTQSKKEFDAIQDTLTIVGVDFVKNPRLVRGLDYYQGLIFEFKSDRLGAQDTFCAGGRYDIGYIFDKKLPSIGLGLGLERLEIILEEEQKIQRISRAGLVAIIVDQSMEAKNLALCTSRELSSSNIRNQVFYDIENLGKALATADKFGASKTIIIGSQEIISGMLTLKNMLSGEQTSIKQAEIIKALKT